MSTFTLAILFDHFQFALIHGPNSPGSCAVLFFTASEFTSITSHIHHWVFFSLWLHLFTLSGAISSLFSCSILGTSWPRELIFQCHICLPFHTVPGVLNARILKWFPFPSPVVGQSHLLFPRPSGRLLLFPREEFPYFFWSFIHLFVLSTHFGRSL